MPPWLKGNRGEWYVVLQIVLFTLILFGPRNLPLFPSWNQSILIISTPLGLVLIGVGILIATISAVQLGTNLTPLPHPKSDSELVTSGLYRIVRHPIYSGIIFATTGWALFAQGLLTLAYAAILFMFFDIKSRREEVWLLERFPEYKTYSQRVRKLIPGIY
jgi:protein-S-isoprenylcysteine O-methyltransferase Ste14